MFGERDGPGAGIEAEREGPAPAQEILLRTHVTPSQVPIVLEQKVNSVVYHVLDDTMWRVAMMKYFPF